MAANQTSAIGVLFDVDYDVIVRNGCFQRGTTLKFLKYFRTFFVSILGQSHGVLILFEPIKNGLRNLFLFWSVAVNPWGKSLFFCLFWRRASEIVSARVGNPPASLKLVCLTSKQGQNVPLYAHAKDPQARTSKQTSLVLTSWRKVFWNFIVMGSTKIGYLDPKIEFSIRKYINSQILVRGHYQSSAVPPHPTVNSYYFLMVYLRFLWRCALDHCFSPFKLSI